MTDLKNDFREWLIKQGLSEKTTTGRQGTVYEYIRRIEKICNTIYAGHNLQPWQQLAEDIYPILGIHTLCKKGDVHITQSNISKTYPFLITMLSNLYPYQENMTNLFIVELVVNDDLLIENYTQIKDLLHHVTTETIIIKPIGSLIQNSKNRNALEKFYLFLADTKYVNPDSSYYKRFIEKNDIEHFYDLLAQDICDIVSYAHDIDKNLELKSIIIGGTGITPPQIDSVDTEAYPQTVCDILRISERTRKRLEMRGDLIPLSNGNYSVEAVNKYIRDRFVKSKYTATNDSYPHWWNISEVHEKTGLSKKTIQRLHQSDSDENEVAYVKISERIYIYYPPDVKRKRKIRGTNTA